MSQQKDLLREIAAAMSAGAPDRISDWFTEDFRLHEPGKPALPVGPQGHRPLKVRFAGDWPLEGGGFEPSVPRMRPSPPWPLNLLQP